MPLEAESVLAFGIAGFQSPQPDGSFRLMMVIERNPFGLRAVRQRGLTILGNAFKSEKGWIKIHAAESLMDFGASDLVDQGVVVEKGTWEGSSEIGLCRVMYRNSADPSQKQHWIEKIESSYTDQKGLFRLNALESLCKLEFIAAGNTLEQIRLDSEDFSKPEAPFALWALHLAGHDGAAARIGTILTSSDCKMRMLAAFCLRWMKCGALPALNQLVDAAIKEPRASDAYPFIRSAAISLKADDKNWAEWKQDLVALLEAAECSVQFEICQALKNDFTFPDLETLLVLLASPDADARIGSATAIINLVDRELEFDRNMESF